MTGWRKEERRLSFSDPSEVASQLQQGLLQAIAMLRGLLDLSTSVQGASLIFKTGLKMQGADLIRAAPSPSFPQRDQPFPPSHASSIVEAAPSPERMKEEKPTVSSFVLDLRPEPEYRASIRMGDAELPSPPKPIVDVRPSHPTASSPTPLTPTYTSPELTPVTSTSELVLNPSIDLPSSSSPPPLDFAAPSSSSLRQTLAVEPSIVQRLQESRSSSPDLSPVEESSVEGWVEQEDRLNEVSRE